jgi:DNA-binding MarR family transcriptional regulator/N-acetylglutamate synthase-like GNAT family acetyltransferase
MERELVQRVAEVRAFNRFYTRLIGVLREGHLASPFSLAQVRVLYELAHQDGPTASALCEQLALDPGYLSRMLRDLERRGLMTGRKSADDARRRRLALTAKGKRTVGDLERKADAAIAAVLAQVPPGRQDEVMQAMRRIRAALEPEAAAAAAPEAAASALAVPTVAGVTRAAAAGAARAAEAGSAGAPFLLRAHRPGDLGWIVHRHGALYAEEHGWDERFEAMVARIAADFVDHFDPKRERCWIAERAGAIVGSVFLVAKSKTVAQLRMLYVEPHARGLGLGRHLVAECTRFARQAGYRKIVLWTNSVLAAARRLYVAEGYRLVREEPHPELGPGRAQTWELELTRASRRSSARSTRPRRSARA